VDLDAATLGDHSIAARAEARFDDREFFHCRKDRMKDLTLG